MTTQQKNEAAKMQLSSASHAIRVFLLKKDEPQDECCVFFS